MKPIKDGQIHLYTFKEGMLSAIAHDLRLSVGRFRIQVDDDRRVRAMVFPESIEVDGVMRAGVLDPRGVSERDRAKIKTTIASHVLRTSQFGRVQYEGTAVAVEQDTFRAQGELTLVGSTRAIAFDLRLEDRVFVGALELTPSEWGIKPYSALGGTLRVQDRVRVEFAIPAPADLS